MSLTIELLLANVLYASYSSLHYVIFAPGTTHKIMF